MILVFDVDDLKILEFGDPKSHGFQNSLRFSCFKCCKSRNANLRHLRLLKTQVVAFPRFYGNFNIFWLESPSNRLEGDT